MLIKQGWSPLNLLSTVGRNIRFKVSLKFDGHLVSFIVFFFVVCLSTWDLKKTWARHGYLVRP